MSDPGDAQRPAAIPTQQVENGRFIVNGPVFQDRGDHVFAIIEDI